MYFPTSRVGGFLFAFSRNWRKEFFVSLFVFLRLASVSSCFPVVRASSILVHALPIGLAITRASVGKFE